jgi:hypothetical protein
MEVILAYDENLEFVRRQLDDLVLTRSKYGWMRIDELRYLELCEKERDLLGMA